MTLLDRFRTQPPLKHPDPVVRLSYIQEVSIDERALLAAVAREDEDARVRRAAVAKLMDPTALGAVASSDTDDGVREKAIAMLRDIALDAFEGLAEGECLAAVEAISDARTLAAIAKSASREEVALRALSRVNDVRALGSIARHAQLEPIRMAALAAVQDRSELLSVASNSDFKDTALAAIERLSDRVDLEQLAARGKNRTAVKRARGILREMDERAEAQAAAEARAVRVAREQQEAEVEAQRAEEARRRADEEARDREAAAAWVEAEASRGRAYLEARAAQEREEQLARDRQRLEAQAEEDRRRAEEQAAVERQRAAERAEAEAREARVRQGALTRLTQLAVRVESLIARPDVTLKGGERALRDVRAALTDTPALPSKQDHDEVTQRLRDGQAALNDKVSELRELTEWRRWANVGIEERLCAKMEALAALEDPSEIAHQVRELQQQWRAASDVPRSQGDLLWRRFKAAHDAVWPRCEAHFAAEAEARNQNLARKIAMCEKAESLADSTRWIQTAEEIKRLQAEWKTIGPVTRGQEKTIWERFRSACDRFFTRRQADLADLKKRWAANLEKKEALCVRAEAIADSTEWDAAAAELRRLQNEWKAIGPVKKSRSEPIWQRFRTACDRFLVRYAQRHEIARVERVTAREAICAELEALASSPEGSQEASADAQGVLDKVRALRTRWNQEIAARGVDRERAATLDQRFAAAFAAVLGAWPAAFAGTDLDPDANRRRLENLVRRIEDLANALGPSGAATADTALSPTTRAAAMLKEALAANTIGGRIDDDSRLRAAADEVRQAQANWARVGPVPEGIRRPLAERFARACARIAEKAGAAGRTVKAGR
jgi:hypothetical protein